VPFRAGLESRFKARSSRLIEPDRQRERRPRVVVSYAQEPRSALWLESKAAVQGPSQGEARLTDDDLDVINGRQDQLEGRIQDAMASPRIKLRRISKRDSYHCHKNAGASAFRYNAVKFLHRETRGHANVLVNSHTRGNLHRIRNQRLSTSRVLSSLLCEIARRLQSRRAYLCPGSRSAVDRLQVGN
jgi:hypothetical protein